MASALRDVILEEPVDELEVSLAAVHPGERQQVSRRFLALEAERGKSYQVDS
jgi:hypothetical protein